jgi:hypothetical protein
VFFSFLCGQSEVLYPGHDAGNRTTQEERTLIEQIKKKKIESPKTDQLNRGNPQCQPLAIFDPTLDRVAAPHQNERGDITDVSKKDRPFP